MRASATCALASAQRRRSTSMRPIAIARAPTTSCTYRARNLLQPPKPSTRPSPKRICGCAPAFGISRTTSQRVPAKGLGGGSFGVVAQAGSRTSNATIDPSFIQPPWVPRPERSRLFGERLEVREPQLEVRTGEAIDHQHEVMAQRVAADIALAGPGDARAVARRLEAEHALRAHAVVGKQERVLDQLVGLDARELHHPAAFALAHPRPLGAHAEGRAVVGDLHAGIALRPRAPLRPLLRGRHEVVDLARRSVHHDRALQLEVRRQQEAGPHYRQGGDAEKRQGPLDCLHANSSSGYFTLERCAAVTSSTPTAT